MKKFFFIFICFFLIQTSKAQDSVSVEKSLIGSSVSPFGSLSFDYEVKLSKEWTLLSNISAYYDYDKGSNLNSKGYSIRPILGLEPRWYYNLDRRNRLSKNIKFNAGNYWSLDIDYHLKSILATNQSNYTIENSIYFLHSYGMRRIISKNLYFDGSLYIGYSQVFGYETFPVSNPDFYSSQNGGSFYFGLKLRVGLNFITKK